MKSIHKLFFIVFALMLMASLPSVAQVPLPQKGKTKDQSAQPQRQIDEQLARSFYNNKEYYKAAELYNQLYQKYNYYHYFSQYIEKRFSRRRFLYEALKENPAQIICMQMML